MMNLSLTMFFCIALSSLAFSQLNRSDVTYGEKGLAVTNALINELDLPDWYWAGAHITENVSENYRLVDSEILEQFFGPNTDYSILDPQGILKPDERSNIENIITTHNKKSAIPMSVNVLASGQKLSITEAELKRRLLNKFKNKNVLVNFYFYGSARDGKGYVIIGDQGFIKDWEVNELFLKSAREASVQVDSYLQMEDYLKNISKRSFWLEKRIIPKKTSKISENTDRSDQAESTEHANSNNLLNFILYHSFTLVCIFWLFSAGIWYFLWSRKWRKYVIPSHEVPVRLGADHGANISDFIEFSDPKISLTEQYERTKNREL